MPDLHRLRATLLALIDRIIPADDFPSASQNNVDVYLNRLLATDLAHRSAEVLAGLESLDAESKLRHGLLFAEISAEQQDALLREIELDRAQSDWLVPHVQWFELMVALTNEGYYADPGNGANLDCISWKMIGYDPKVPTASAKESWVDAVRRKPNA